MKKLAAASVLALTILLLVGLLRQRCVPGTWRRYVYASVEWALAPPALANAPFQLLFDDDPLFWKAVTVLNFCVALWALQTLINDGDDNYWRRKRKQLKQYLKSFGLRPSLAGARS